MYRREKHVYVSIVLKVILSGNIHNSLEITVGLYIFSRDQRKRDVILYIVVCHAKPYRAARRACGRQ